VKWLAVLAIFLSGEAVADGGLVRLDEVIPEGRLVALTAPTPVVEGTLDLTVLVPEGVEVSCTLAVWDDWVPSGPWQTLVADRPGHPEGVGALLAVAPGRWRVWLRVGDHLTSFRLEVGERSTWSDAWPWLLPLAVVAAVVFLRRQPKKS
jgi:hypothetical protein